MNIDDKLIEYLADLSRLELDTEEKAARKKDLADILDYMEKLNEIDTAGLPEMTHPFGAVNRFREDVVTNGDRTEELLANAPDRKGPYFRVPRTVEE
ncbi:MAG: Asp-tRNA(Asn)/Glu-tRNA(Gln) amidotransferase subunit GatC [Clostridiales Family XIII bacterium]|jgi:aspartyl-tRNA(Asn)/glutamyl-tRNA(Gln) amidotransferase subunit C|nr:Asp-tRNA(Asn)/Glu-tRNA(Gln) amidotransferase subunit GatC [Clostridiales Family XIII bacterium]